MKHTSRPTQRTTRTFMPRAGLNHVLTTTDLTNTEFTKTMLAKTTTASIIAASLLSAMAFSSTVTAHETSASLGVAGSVPAPVEPLPAHLMHRQTTPSANSTSSLHHRHHQPQQAPQPATVQPQNSADWYQQHTLQQQLKTQSNRQIPTLLQAQNSTLAECSSTMLSDFGRKTGQALVDHILASPSTCIDELFSGSDTAIRAFASSNMQAVANATAQAAQRYDSTVTSMTIGKLYYFLRAGYYVQYYNPSKIPAYGSAVQQSVRAALDALINNPAFYHNSSGNGLNIQDAITLIDSAGENARYIPMVKQWLQRWDQSYANDWYMRAAVNQIFTVLFRGHYDDAFVSATRNDTELMRLLGQFSQQDWMLDSNADFLQENAAAELARFLQYADAPIASSVKAQVQAILQRYQMQGRGAAVWLKAASAADYYGYCAEFSICGFQQQLEQQVLSQQHSCSSTMKFRSQQMEPGQFAGACQQVSAQEQYFHRMLATAQRPIAGDKNENLEMVVFDSSADYGQYAGLFFGIDTNNGGMYLEGQPEVAGNQARFIAYEAEWLRPDFSIWNLTHEMVHYLDGRFNLKGGFGDYKVDSHKTVWWVEGLAEYISQKNRNDAAIALARTQQFSLSQIFGNTYNSGQDRVYRWGYLAVRFMFERQPQTVAQLLKHFRSGNYDAYLAQVNALGTSLDAEFRQWLLTVQSDDSVPTPNLPSDPPADGQALQNGVAKTNISATRGQWQHFYIDVPTGQQKLTVQQQLGSGDADLYVRVGQQPTATSYSCRPYKSGNNESCSIDNPAAGRWFVSSFAYSNFTGVSLTASFSQAPTQPNACANQVPVDYVQLTLGKAYCVIAGNNDSYAYFYFYNDVANSRVQLQLFGSGEGNADLYFSSGSWPTAQQHQLKSTNAGHQEQISTGPLAVGWHYIAVKASPNRPTTTLQLTAQP